MATVPEKPTAAVLLQRRYYTETASRYDQMHFNEGGADPALVDLVVTLARMLDARSILDVGCANGRSLRSIRRALPHCVLYGIEPVDALVAQAVQTGAGSQSFLIRASGEALPLPDASIDVVCEFATLHHLENPNAMVQEMLRVARRAVILCDSNRFGQGPFLARLLKLALYKVGLWPAVTFLRTGGKGYLFTEGDGVAYSYSVYDSFGLLAKWADKIIPIPTDNRSHSSWFHPLLTSGGVILCAIRETHEKP